MWLRYGERSVSYRGHKLSLYEGGIRLPFIVRWPGHVPAGRVDEASVFTALDIFPTLCALAGAALPTEHRLEGIDVSAAWRGGSAPQRDALFWEYGRNDAFFKFGPDRSPNLAVRRGDWKLLIDADGGRAELYHLAADRGETRNLAAEHPELTRELSLLVRDWRASWPAKRS